MYERLPFWWTGVGVSTAVVNAGQEAGGGAREPAALATEQTYIIGSKKYDLISLDLRKALDMYHEWVPKLVHSTHFSH